MTKQEVLQDIDKLCGDIDKWITEYVSGVSLQNSNRVIIARRMMEELLVSAHQELSFLRDYIDEKVKEDVYQEGKVDGNTTVTPSDRYGDLRLKEK